MNHYIVNVKGKFLGQLLFKISVQTSKLGQRYGSTSFWNWLTIKLHIATIGVCGDQDTARFFKNLMITKKGWKNYILEINEW